MSVLTKEHQKIMHVNMAVWGAFVWAGDICSASAVHTIDGAKT